MVSVLSLRKCIIVIIVLCLVSFGIGTQFNLGDDSDKAENANTVATSGFSVELEDNNIAPIEVTGGEEKFFDIFFEYYDTMCAFKLHNSDVKKVYARQALYIDGKLVETTPITSADLDYEVINKCFFAVSSVSDNNLLSAALVTKDGKSVSKVYDIETSPSESRFNPLQPSEITSGTIYPVFVSLNEIGDEPLVDVESDDIDELLKQVIGNNSRKVANAKNVEVIYLEFK